ncbi:Skp1-domain-containing protein [Cryphonectria parasitica EP155]|uniref:Skp1-domain-containing protein n=1 Tax=Cryphonectria parasitica (strain ATCC 38755 / EP155) TaxID=660469 RepID=A0A9P5CKJ9_CRYP1|nr:Skp1-domain-containing protein [Cryphonectria parasitica EP155]KAF3761237.1 Skp1-domain-containing protein [Cryphonectria parasitica EP155]
MLLNRYLDECAHYTNAAQIIDHVFRYLNRHWIKRELDEGKKSIYDVYTLHFVFWHNELFKEIAPLLVDAVSELVDKHHEEAMIEIGTSNAFIEFIVSLEPGGTEVSGFTREVYGNLLETPLRIALEASAYQDLPAFLYERPITTSTFIGGLARKEIEERLVTLVGHSGFDQRLPNGGDRDTGTVRLVTNDLVVVEADQKAVECSVLIKHLCTYFGKKIIARELIPLPSVTEPVLRKVLEWCEYHAHDADNTNIHSVASYNINSPGVDEWDRNYFDIDTDILFEIVLAANYLDIEQLLNGGCKAIANLIKGKTPEEIRETFNITNDFTPEEEEQIRLENEWSEDR